MRLRGVRTGDVVQVDRLGRVFFAVVAGTTADGLALRPCDKRITYRSCRAREVIGHWARQGRPIGTAEELEPSPRQMTLELG